MHEQIPTTLEKQERWKQISEAVGGGWSKRECYDKAKELKEARAARKREEALKADAKVCALPLPSRLLPPTYLPACLHPKPHPLPRMSHVRRRRCRARWLTVALLRPPSVRGEA